VRPPFPCRLRNCDCWSKHITGQAQVVAIQAINMSTRLAPFAPPRERISEALRDRRSRFHFPANPEPPHANVGQPAAFSSAAAVRKFRRYGNIVQASDEDYVDRVPSNGPATSSPTISGPCDGIATIRSATRQRDRQARGNPIPMPVRSISESWVERSARSSFTVVGPRFVGRGVAAPDHRSAHSAPRAHADARSDTNVVSSGAISRRAATLDRHVATPSCALPC